MDALITSFLIHAPDPVGTCMKIGMTPSDKSNPLADCTVDQLIDYMRPWGDTVSRIAGCQKIVLHDGLPQGVVDHYPLISFVKLDRLAQDIAWMQRFRDFGHYLRSCPEIDRVFFADINDCGVMSDPFAWHNSLKVPEAWLVMGEEARQFKVNPWFTEKYEHLPAEYRDLFEREIASSLPVTAGVWGGWRQPVLDTIQAVVEAFDQYAAHYRHHNRISWDMFMLNAVVFRGGPYVGFKTTSIAPQNEVCGATIRNIPAPNPFMHDRREVIDHLGTVRDSWNAGRVIERVDAGLRGNVQRMMNTPRCHPDGPYTPVDRCVGLLELILDMYPRSGTVVETGRYHGVSTECFAILRPDAEIISVDSFSHEAAWPRLAPYRNVKLITADAEEYAKEFGDQNLMAVYLDDDHSYEAVKRRLLAWRPKVMRGGIISGHDYTHENSGVVRACWEVFGSPPHRVYSDSSWGYVLT